MFVLCNFDTGSIPGWGEGQFCPHAPVKKKGFPTFYNPNTFQLGELRELSSYFNFLFFFYLQFIDHEQMPG